MPCMLGTSLTFRHALLSCLPPIHDIECCPSGLYLAVGGTDARIYGVKQDWGVLQTFPDLPSQVRSSRNPCCLCSHIPSQPKQQHLRRGAWLQGAFSVKFGANAKALYVGSGDHNLRVYSSPAAAS